MIRAVLGMALIGILVSLVTGNGALGGATFFGMMLLGFVGWVMDTRREGRVDRLIDDEYDHRFRGNGNPDPGWDLPVPGSYREDFDVFSGQLRAAVAALRTGGPTGRSDQATILDQGRLAQYQLRELLVRGDVQPSEGELADGRRWLKSADEIFSAAEERYGVEPIDGDWPFEFRMEFGDRWDRLEQLAARLDEQATPDERWFQDASDAIVQAKAAIDVDRSTEWLVPQRDMDELAAFLDLYTGLRPDGGHLINGGC